MLLLDLVNDDLGGWLLAVLQVEARL